MLKHISVSLVVCSDSGLSGRDCFRYVVTQLTDCLSCAVVRVFLRSGDHGRGVKELSRNTRNN